jgi:hypothetical protein
VGVGFLRGGVVGFLRGVFRFRYSSDQGVLDPVNIGPVVFRGPIHLCSCVSEKRRDCGCVFVRVIRYTCLFIMNVGPMKD